MEKFTTDATLDQLEAENRDIIRRAAQALGRKGGSVRSEKKARACRENGKKNKGKKLPKLENIIDPRD